MKLSLDIHLLEFIGMTNLPAQALLLISMRMLGVSGCPSEIYTPVQPWREPIGAEQSVGQETVFDK
jgi:hypothetical protein